MSWNFAGVGKPDALVRAIDKSIEGYSEGSQSRQEYEAVAPHLKGLILEAHSGAAVSVSAQGHCTITGGVKTYSYIDVAIKQIGTICE